MIGFHDSFGHWLWQIISKQHLINKRVGLLGHCWRSLKFSVFLCSALNPNTCIKSPPTDKDGFICLSGKNKGQSNKRVTAEFHLVSPMQSQGLVTVHAASLSLELIGCTSLYLSAFWFSIWQKVTGKCHRLHGLRDRPLCKTKMGQTEWRWCIDL